MFAVNTWDRWSNAASNEFDISVDVDTTDRDYFVVGVDIGAVTTGDFNGPWARSCSARQRRGERALPATAPTDSSARCSAGLEPALPADGAVSVGGESAHHLRGSRFDLINGGADVMPGWRSTTPGRAPSARVTSRRWLRAGRTQPISVNPAEWALTPAMGLMIVTFDDRSTQGNEADLVELFLK